ncbi:MAG: septum formation protein Maf [Clostridia bacterium]|jgi:septum formation protein|nr:septum formation protein Maf [Clostridia bacterium]MBQ1943348.1 septum formation protein Maf [Clostridia bacterium]MBQ5802457.1 septum formation protein Maf [Clostridia bacterium]
MKVVLASLSPRRKQLLATLLPQFEIIGAEGEESAEGANPSQTAMLRAEQKAREVKARLQEKAVVIGSDTIVALNGEILGKPQNSEDAKRMLRALSGKSHQVITGVAFLGERISRVLCDITTVRFHSLSEELIERYVATGSPLDKAGAYGIQDGFPLVKEYVGSYDNVVGFPTELMKSLLIEEGVL